MSAVAKPVSAAPRAKSNYALFLGDLSIFCTEKDIEEAFQQFGEIVNIRIQRSKETSRALSYGFIEYSCETAAVSAMNEMNGYVLKGRPLRIRWAAKRNQPVKSDNPALQSAATIFVKFASQTGIIVNEEILRDHFTAYGKVLDATIRTITIDEAFNRSKGYGFVNFINDPENDGLGAAYRASAELQNQTINGVNYRCEVGYKHQQQGHGQGPHRSDSDSYSMSAQSVGTSGNASASISAASMGGMPQQGPTLATGSGSGRGFLPALSPKQMYSGSSVNSGAAVSQSPSYSHSHSHSSSAPSSPHPAAYYGVNSQAISSGASVVSQGSGSTGMFSQNSPYGAHSPHGHHPVSAIVSTISFVPNNPNGVAQMYPQSVSSFPAVPQAQQYPQAQPYYPAPQAGGYGTPPQQQAYVAQPAGYYPSSPHHQHQGGYFAAPMAAPQYYDPAHVQSAGYYPQQAPAEQYYSAPQADGYGNYYQQQHAAQGYYAQPAPMPMVAPVQGSGMPSPRPPAAVYDAPHGLTEQALSQHARTRRPSILPQTHAPPSYTSQLAPMQNPYGPTPMPVPEVVDGRRSQRNISNKSNISEITSATLNELQCEDDEEVEDEEVPQPPAAAAAAAAAEEEPVQQAASATETTTTTSSNSIELANALKRHLKSTLQTQSNNTTPPTINCRLTARRGKRSVSGGSNATEITAAVLYDLQQQEQRLEKEEEEEGFTEPPKIASSRNLTTTPVEEASAADVTAKMTMALAASRLTNTPEPAAAAAEEPSRPAAADVSESVTTPSSRRRRSATASAESTPVVPAKSISPFTLSAAALARLQSECEAADASARPQRRSKRNISDRSNQSDITAALAYMQVEYSDDMFRSLDDDGESYSSGAHSASACVCGKARASPMASCPFGTTACSCVYTATC